MFLIEIVETCSPAQPRHRCVMRTWINVDYIVDVRHATVICDGLRPPPPWIGTIITMTDRHIYVECEPQAFVERLTAAVGLQGSTDGRNPRLVRVKDHAPEEPIPST